MHSLSKYAKRALPLVLLGIVSLAQAGTLTLTNLHTNTNVTWTLGSSTETSGSGAFYGDYDGAAVDPMYCIDLMGWVSVPAGFAATRQATYTGAGWLVDTYGATASNSALLASALQFAIWNATYESDLTLDSGVFAVSRDSFSGAAIAQGNAYLAAMGNRKAWAYEYVRGAGGPGQSQIAAIPGLTNVTAVPGPAGALAFALGLARRRRRAVR